LIPGGGSPMPAKLTVVGTTLFFTAADAAKGRELWKLENTANAIPKRISDIIVGPGSSGIDNLTDFNGVLHFTASSGQATGDRLFKTNATNTSVAAVGGTMSNADNLMAAGFKLFFTQSPEAGAPQLCKLENGTTTVLRTFDLLLDGQSSIPQKLTAAGDQIFFTAADAENGRELWKSDGDTTMLVSDIRDGVGGANILEIRLAGQNLFLSANNRTHGQEPWFLANAFALQGGAAETRLVVPVPLVIADGIKVYPNPTTHFVNVDLPENDRTGTLSIVSASGQLVRSVQSVEGETSIQLDVQDLPKGVYLVRWVQSDEQVVVKKLIVQ
jgi:ELWxxDGT repeat protein